VLLLWRWWLLLLLLHASVVPIAHAWLLQGCRQYACSRGPVQVHCWHSSCPIAK
jgi:hypothetical protein